jgi:hypothetical protein
MPVDGVRRLQPSFSVMAQRPGKEIGGRSAHAAPPNLASFASIGIDLGLQSMYSFSDSPAVGDSGLSMPFQTITR